MVVGDTIIVKKKSARLKVVFVCKRQIIRIIEYYSEEKSYVYQ